MQKMLTLTVRVDEQLRDGFKIKCDEVGLSQNKALIQLMELVNQGDISLMPEFVVEPSQSAVIDDSILQSLQEDNKRLQEEMKALKSAIALNPPSNNSPAKETIKDRIDILFSEYQNTFLKEDVRELVEKQMDAKLQPLRQEIANQKDWIESVQSSVEDIENSIDDHIKKFISPLKSKVSTLERDFIDWRIKVVTEHQSRTESQEDDSERGAAET